METLTRVQKIENFIKTLSVENLDLPYLIDAKEVNSFDDMLNQLEENNGFDVEIIYYASAIKYLSENDNSLRNSLEIAADMGFELKNLNSETLASLLASQTAREDFQELESEITSFFDELEEEETEEA